MPMRTLPARGRAASAGRGGLGAPGGTRDDLGGAGRGGGQTVGRGKGRLVVQGRRRERDRRGDSKRGRGGDFRRGRGGGGGHRLGGRAAMQDFGGEHGQGDQQADAADGDEAPERGDLVSGQAGQGAA